MLSTLEHGDAELRGFTGEWPKKLRQKLPKPEAPPDTWESLAYTQVSLQMKNRFFLGTAVRAT